MSKTSTTAASTQAAPSPDPVPEQPCTGCANKATPCTDCPDCASAPQTDAQINPTPAAGGRYMRAEDGTLTPIEE